MSQSTVKATSVNCFKALERHRLRTFKCKEHHGLS